MRITRFEDLRVYQQAFEAAMRLYSHSRAWPREERYALTNQVRRSSRSVCANVAEAWRKRRYPRHFVSKLTDADAEAAETRVWIRFAHRCGYLNADEAMTLDAEYDRLSAGLVRMMRHPEQWLVREDDIEYTPGSPPTT